ncbi:WD-repeat protein [Cyanidioschyzon merolae strain 10D]|jgi:WD repeat-containing protein 23|uniref:WD-repeat protein n=1 Tax=Cyanidioschyzon merolae (strain NIES-3377 / 10D) TaxID=280699 RepID=M1UW89_CYAM1|nr:WD-repeat protein [Cyanidioschyzon merolae strain 10D]BAM82411.1 WD-repeat protein [Cyanidioschyzon merolae strain 10D]|eukprot:XP_005538447.1 WD-repeat protein [Cyanidioschyzon merolae strain 10D]
MPRLRGRGSSRSEETASHESTPTGSTAATPASEDGSGTSRSAANESDEWSASALGAALVQGLRALLEDVSLSFQTESSGERPSQRRRSRRQHLQFQRYASSRLAPNVGVNRAAIQADIAFPQALWQLDESGRERERSIEDIERMEAVLTYLSYWLGERNGSRVVYGSQQRFRSPLHETDAALRPVWAIRLGSVPDALRARECTAEAVPMPGLATKSRLWTEPPQLLAECHRERLEQFLHLLLPPTTESNLPLDAQYFSSFWYRFLFLEKELLRSVDVRQPTAPPVHYSQPLSDGDPRAASEAAGISAATSTDTCSSFQQPWSRLYPGACSTRAPGAASRSLPCGFHDAAMASLQEHYVPQFPLRKLDVYSARAYGCRFFDEGRLLVTSCQDRRLRLYDTSALDVFEWCGGSPEHSLLERWERPPSEQDCRARLPVSEVIARDLRWTVTDVDWSRQADGTSWLAYASITPRVYLVRLDAVEAQQALSFAAPANLVLDQSSSETGAAAGWTNLLDAENSYGLGIWSVRFRPDGSELVAGASHTGHVFGDLVVYRLERQAPVASLRAHQDDVNSVAVAGANLILSAADDAYIHVWDRRDLRRPCGSFVGHTEGITHVSWRGEEVAPQLRCATDLLDQRYVVSIGKDQRCKLWDIRLLREASQVERPRPTHYDYRWNDMVNPPLDNRRTLRGDNSLYTFIGMRVLSTLIRAYFSPLSTTSGRYIYTGSQDGRICLFDTVSGMPLTALRGHEAAVREMSWSPRLPGVLVSAGWDGQALIWRPAGVEDH